MIDIVNRNPQDFLSIVADVQILNWGSLVRVTCLDDPVTRQAYVITFMNCTQVRCDVHEPEDVLDSEDDLIGMIVGKENHQEPTIITGRIFELWVWYEKYEIARVPQFI